MLEILRAASQIDATANADSLARAIRDCSEDEFTWSMDAGLGPFVYATIQHSRASVPANRAQLLLSSDLTAIVRHGSRVETAIELIDLCDRMGLQVTLLKGISIAEQCYSSPHHRPMTDVDLLVPHYARDAVQAEALRLGYREFAPIMGPDPHHAEPIYRHNQSTKAEIHSALFQSRSAFRLGRLFDPETIQRCWTDESEFEGRTVRRLAPELQIAYIASYFHNDLSSNSIHPSFAFPIMDVVRLLAVRGTEIKWSRLLSNLDNAAARTSLAVLIGYLRNQGLACVPKEAWYELTRNSTRPQRTEWRLLQKLIHNYLVAGRPFSWFNSWHVWRNSLEPGRGAMKLARLPWRIVFPPYYPDRFSPHAQLTRLSRRLGED